MSNDFVICPYCREKIGDLWDYDWGYSDEIEGYCPSCDNSILLARIVYVDYEISKDDE